MRPKLQNLVPTCYRTGVETYAKVCNVQIVKNLYLYIILTALKTSLKPKIRHIEKLSVSNIFYKYPSQNCKYIEHTSVDSGKISTITI